MKRLLPILAVCLLSGCASLDLDTIIDAAPVADPVVAVEADKYIRASFLFDGAGTRVMNILGRGWTRDKFREIVARCKANGDTHILLYTANWGDGPGGSGNARNQTSFYYSGFAGNVCEYQLYEMVWRLRYCNEQGLTPILWLMADDSKSFIPYKDVPRLKKYASDMVENIPADFYQEIVICLEVDEVSDKATMYAVAKHLQGITDKRIGLHMTSGKYDWAEKCPDIDVIWYQYGWLSSSDKLISETRKVLGKTTKPLVATEYRKGSNGGWGAKLLEAIQDKRLNGYGNG